MQIYSGYTLFFYKNQQILVEPGMFLVFSELEADIVLILFLHIDYVIFSDFSSNMK